jgi:hypothetical protein
VIIKIIRVMVGRDGFDVAYHPVDAPCDVRAATVRYDARGRLPSGSDLLYSGAVVDVVVRNGQITYTAVAYTVSAPLRVALTA